MRMRSSWWLLWGAFQRNNNKKSIVVPDIRFLTNEKESLKKNDDNDKYIGMPMECK